MPIRNRAATQLCPGLRRNAEELQKDIPSARPSFGSPFPAPPRRGTDRPAALAGPPGSVSWRQAQAAAAAASKGGGGGSGRVQAGPRAPARAYCRTPAVRIVPRPPSPAKVAVVVVAAAAAQNQAPGGPLRSGRPQQEAEEAKGCAVNARCWEVNHTLLGNFSSAPLQYPRP